MLVSNETAALIRRVWKYTRLAIIAVECVSPDLAAAEPAGPRRRRRLRASLRRKRRDDVRSRCDPPDTSVIGKIAATAAVKQLVLSHRMLRTLGREPATLTAIRSSYGGAVTFADDLQCFTRDPDTRRTGAPHHSHPASRIKDTVDEARISSSENVRSVIEASVAIRKLRPPETCRGSDCVLYCCNSVVRDRSPAGRPSCSRCEESIRPRSLIQHGAHPRDIRGA